MTNSHLFSVYYIPWVLILLAIIILVPLLMRLSYLDKKSESNTFRTYEHWRSLLIFPTFVGGVGIVLTIFSLIFSYTQQSSSSSIHILLPLCLFCFIFTLLTKMTYTRLKDHTNHS